MRRLRRFSLVVFFLASCAFAQTAPNLGHLKRGVNISSWFAQASGPDAYSKQRLQSRITKQDLALIKSLGFDHVRVCVDPKPMFNPRNTELLPADYLSYLDDAVNMILAADLAVIIDIQPDDDFKAKLGDDDFVERFADFWRALARHYGGFNPKMVFLGLLNEPELRDRYRWSGIQARLVAAIRESAPQHTIIATGAGYSGNDELVFLEPLRDSNVIYSFHFYEPLLFTHQGADWSVYFWHELRGIRYPSDPKSAERPAQQLPSPDDQLYVRRYGSEHWDASRIEIEIAAAGEWAKRRHVSIICDEFGVFPKYTDPQDREAWLRDVHASLQRNGIPWTLWDYDGSFGMVSRAGGKILPDPVVVRALELNP